MLYLSIYINSEDRKLFSQRAHQPIEYSHHIMKGNQRRKRPIYIAFQINMNISSKVIRYIFIILLLLFRVILTDSFSFVWPHHHIY